MGGTITVEVIDKQMRSDLPEGGLEVPCMVTLQHTDEQMIDKAKAKQWPVTVSKSKSKPEGVRSYDSGAVSTVARHSFYTMINTHITLIL